MKREGLSFRMMKCSVCGRKWEKTTRKYHWLTKKPIFDDEGCPYCEWQKMKGEFKEEINEKNRYLY